LSSVPVNGNCSTQITKYAYPGLEPAADSFRGCRVTALDFLPQNSPEYTLAQERGGYLLIAASGFRTDSLR
jgi:hypothetical protein